MTPLALIHHAQTISIVRILFRLSQYSTGLNSKHSEIEREANIARNRALLEELELKDAVASLGLSKPPPGKSSAKPVQSAKRVKRQRTEDVGPRRTSARLRTAPVIDPNESPRSKRQREVRNCAMILKCRRGLNLRVG